MENPIVQNNQNSQMPMMVAALGIGAVAMMIAFGPFGALLAVGAIMGATAIGAAITQSRTRGISQDTQRMAKQMPERTAQPIQLATKPTKAIDVTPSKQMSKEELKKWDDLTKETAALVKANEQKPTEPAKPVEVKVENKEDLDKRSPREKLASTMAEIAIAKALLDIKTAPAQRLGLNIAGPDKATPQPNGGFKVISSLFIMAIGRAIADNKPAITRLQDWMKDSVVKKEALAIEQEKSLGIKISESEIQQEIGNIAKYDVYQGRAQVQLGDHWPELIAKAKTIVSPQQDRNAFQGILASLSPDALKTINSAKEQVKTEDHSVKTTEAPRLMSVPRDTAIDAAGMMR